MPVISTAGYTCDIFSRLPRDGGTLCHVPSVVCGHRRADGQRTITRLGSTENAARARLACGACLDRLRLQYRPYGSLFLPEALRTGSAMHSRCNAHHERLKEAVPHHKRGGFQYRRFDGDGRGVRRAHTDSAKALSSWKAFTACIRGMLRVDQKVFLLYREAQKKRIEKRCGAQAYGVFWRNGFPWRTEI